jgi:hypothetical protein
MAVLFQLADQGGDKELVTGKFCSGKGKESLSGMNA